MSYPKWGYRGRAKSVNSFPVANENALGWGARNIKAPAVGAGVIGERSPIDIVTHKSLLGERPARARSLALG